MKPHRILHLNKLILSLLFALVISCGKSPLSFQLKSETTSKIFGEIAKQEVKIIGSFEFKLRVNSDIVMYDENILNLEVFSDQNEQLDMTNFELYLWMPDHSHGSFPIKITKSSEYSYLLSDVYFTMPGLWQVILNERATNKKVIWEIVL